MAAWPPASTTSAIARSATAGLPRSDIALQEPQHPASAGEIGRDLG
jgi:hypothetical protein